MRCVCDTDITIECIVIACHAFVTSELRTVRHYGQDHPTTDYCLSSVGSKESSVNSVEKQFLILCTGTRKP